LGTQEGKWWEAEKVKQHEMDLVMGIENKVTIFNNNNSVALIRERTIPIKRPPLVGEDSAKFGGWRGVTQSARRIPYGRNFGFLDWNRYFFFHVAPQLY
jgi:hypothetical protein